MKLMMNEIDLGIAKKKLKIQENKNFASSIKKLIS